MKGYLFRTGINEEGEHLTPLNLVGDLACLLSEHGFKMGSEPKTYVIERDYEFAELPGLGAIILKYANRNFFKIVSPSGDVNVTAMLFCLGFDEESEEFNELNGSLLELQRKYNINLKDPKGLV